MGRKRGVFEGRVGDGVIGGEKEEAIGRTGDEAINFAEDEVGGKEERVFGRERSSK